MCHPKPRNFLFYDKVIKTDAFHKKTSSKRICVSICTKHFTINRGGEKKKPQMVTLTELSELGKINLTHSSTSRETEPYTTTIQDATFFFTLKKRNGNSALSYRLQLVDCCSVSLCRYNWRDLSTLRIVFVPSAKDTFANNHFDSE